MAKLQEKKIAVLMTDGVEQIEYTSPKKALEDQGATLTVLSLDRKDVKGWNEDRWGDTFSVDKLVSEADPDLFDGLLLPGGVMNPDKLRQDPAAVAFVKAMAAQGKPIAAICHAPQMLIEADAVRGKKLTSYPSLKTDLKNAGADWVDQEVVIDHGLVTSRTPGDLDAFNYAAIQAFQMGLTTESAPEPEEMNRG